MARPTEAEALDLLRALARIRGHEERANPDLVYTQIAAEYTEYRVRDVTHASAMSVVAKRLAERYPTAPPLKSTI